jgi:hypothetical protein
MERPESGKPGAKGPTGLAAAGPYLGLGLTWALSTLLFLWLGSKADAWLGTEPWLTLIGAFTGASAGFYYMYRHLMMDAERSKRERRK